MTNKPLPSLAVLAIVSMVAPVLAHGGFYRGPAPAKLPPGGVPKQPTPPPRNPVPRVPIAPVRPNLPRPTTPSGAVRVPITGGGAADATTWKAWWGFHQDRFLRLKDTVRAGGGPITGIDDWYMGPSRRPGKPLGMAPGLRQKKEKILPALIRALQDTNQPDQVTACLIAIAKLGIDNEAGDVVPLLRRYLKSKHQEIRETAALALGVSGMQAAVQTLEDLVSANKAARRMLGDKDVDDRIRSFAIYGLGIHAGDSADAIRKQRTASMLLDILKKERPVSRDVRVAAVNAMGVLRLDPNKSADDKRVLWGLVEELRVYYEAKLGKGEDYVQAHVPVAIGRLLGRGSSADHQRFVTLFAKELRGRSARHVVVSQSCALALGALVDPDTEDDSARKILQNYSKNGRDQQARYFSLMALGQIGGSENRTFLLRVVTKGNRTFERPWAAMALGVMVNRQQRRDAAVRDVTVATAIVAQLSATKNPDALAAYAVALGLTGSEESGQILRQLLADNEKKDELAGYVCIGLALLGDHKAVPAVRDMVRRALRRPELMRQAAMALGKLGDKAASQLLVSLIDSEGANTARMASVAAALGYIGDRRTVTPLVKLLEDDSLTKLGRAFVAAALGSVADRAPLPFNVRYADGANYRASAPTLTNAAGTGILDIL